MWVPGGSSLMDKDERKRREEAECWTGGEFIAQSDPTLVPSELASAAVLPGVWSFAAGIAQASPAESGSLGHPAAHARSLRWPTEYVQHAQVISAGSRTVLGYRLPWSVGRRMRHASADLGESFKMSQPRRKRAGMGGAVCEWVQVQHLAWIATILPQQ